MGEYILKMKNISKYFPGTRALYNVNIELKEGEVLGLCGENGAGKSTLMKILSGTYPYGSFEGEIFLNDISLKMNNIKDSEEAGIAIIHQEFALVEEMSVAENIFLGSEIAKHGRINFQEMNKKAKLLLDEFDLDINPMTLVKDLGVGHKQLVEIAKALSKNAKILILDEPTAPLTEKEVEPLKKIIKTLVQNNVSCIYISHKLEEIMEMCNRVVVIRDGEVIGTNEIKDIEKEDLIKMMVGRDLNNLYHKENHKIGEITLDVKNYSVYRENDGKKIVDNVTFNLRKGEILGIAGLVGAGRTELVSSLFGTYKGWATGDVTLFGKSYKAKNSVQAIKRGITMVPEDRKGCGIFPIMSVKKNTSIINIKRYKSLFGKIDQNKELIEVDKKIKELKIKTPNYETPISSLSGGNQQKVVIAKYLLLDPEIIIMDEPTRGIDIGAKWEIYKLMNDLVKLGKSIIMVSSELPEIIGMSDRILILNEGKVKGILENKDLTEETIMKYALKEN